MPSTAVRTFSDPDDYAASIRGTSAEMTVVGRGHFKAKLTQIEAPGIPRIEFAPQP